MDFFCMTSSGKHVTLVSMLVTSRELCYLRCLVGIVALVQHSGCFHKAFVIVNILTGPKKGAETGRLEKWGQRERKNQLINNWKERLEESKKINEMEWAKKGLEQKMLALVGRRMDPHARMDKMDKESHKMPTESCILWAKLRDHHTPQRRHRWQKTSWDTPACWIHTQIYTWFIWYSFNLIHVSFDQMIRKFRKDTRISTRWPGGSGGCGTLCIAFDLWRSLRFLESLEKTNPRMKKMEKCHKRFIASNMEKMILKKTSKICTCHMQIVGLKCLQSMIINTTLHQLRSTAQKKSTWRFSPMLRSSH